MDKKKMLREWGVPLVFVIIAVICYFMSGVSFDFLCEQVAVRFIRNGVLVLALIFPIVAGMGLNFSVTVGAMAAQAAYLIVLNHNIFGGKGVLLVFLLTCVLDIAIGFGLGKIMNLVKGREMITSIVIGFLANYIYQLIFIAGYGTVIPVHNPTIVLNRGIGVESMVDLRTFKDFFNSFGSVKIAQINVSYFLIGIVLLMAFGVAYLLRTPFGKRVAMLGYDEEKAQELGVQVDRTRIFVMIISTLLAGIGQFIYLQNIGSLNTFTEHLNVDTFSCAALLVGGASIKSANVKDAIVGVLIMHAIFVVSSLAGQKAFNNVALGEYFRTFIVYGIIALSLIINLRMDNRETNSS